MEIILTNKGWFLDEASQQIADSSKGKEISVLLLFKMGLLREIGNEAAKNVEVLPIEEMRDKVENEGESNFSHMIKVNKL